MTQTYQYDDLFRLMHADGTYQRDEDNTDTYTNDFTYDTINNMLTKNQVHEIDHPSDGSISPRPQTTYDYSYDYGWTIKDTGSLHNGAIAPHIASHIGGKTYKYDRNGNMTKWIDDQTKREMDLTWDDENRLMSTEEQGKLTLYRYDDAGTRVIKRGKNGEVLYVNPDYSLRNGEVGSKHIFAGNTRIATKLTMKEQKLNASKATYDKSLGGHNGRVPEKSRGNHFGWGDTIGTGTSAHGNAYGHDKQAERRAPENHGQLMKLEKASDNAETTKGKGKSKNNGNANANAKSQGNANPHDYKYDTDLPGKSEKGLENALSHGKGHKYGIYKRLARRGLIVNSAGDIVPIGSSGDDVSGETGDDSVTTPTVGNATGAVPEELGIYYYQGDHLGSSNIITDRTGRVYEHLEYFPYGETWVDEQRNKTNLPYQFTGKELDPETGMYYYGARYYEPVTSRWISADPMLESYLPLSEDKKQFGEKWLPERDLPGSGGVYNPINLSLFAYAALNPVKVFDPDGNATAEEREQAVKKVEQYVTAQEKSNKNLYKYGAKGGPGEKCDCSGVTAHAYPDLPAGTTAQRKTTSEVDFDKAMKGDIIFFYKGKHVGIITEVTRDAKGKVTRIKFGHASSSKGPMISVLEPPNKKYKNGSYWYREMDSIRTFKPATDPPRGVYEYKGAGRRDPFNPIIPMVLFYLNRK